MNKMHWSLILNLLVIATLLTGCASSTNKRNQRYWGRPNGDHEHFATRDNFYNADDDLDYVPLTDVDIHGNTIAVRDAAQAAPSKVSPGEAGSVVPGINGFKDPSAFSGAGKIFKNVQFPYNSSLIKEKNSLDALHHMATFLKDHPNTYLFVEGHCDERGAEAYNLALGARRSNAVRNMLIKEGVNPDHLFTISYGKERPSAKGRNEDSWKLNRRAQFKLYQG